jgi:hypothetical protein
MLVTDNHVHAQAHFSKPLYETRVALPVSMSVVSGVHFMPKIGVRKPLTRASTSANFRIDLHHWTLIAWPTQEPSPGQARRGASRRIA